MEAKDLEHRVEVLEHKQNELEVFVNKSVRNIQIGITEIKTMLEEREKQADYKENSTKEDIEKINQKLDTILTEVPKISDHEKRLTKIEDNQQWLWRTIGGTMITLLSSIIVAAIKFFK